MFSLINQIQQIV